MIACLQNLLAALWSSDVAGTRTPSGGFCRQVYRELNTRADAAATRALLTRTGFCESAWPELCSSVPPMKRARRSLPKHFQLRAEFDGGRRESQASLGVSLMCRDSDDADWSPILRLGQWLGDVSVPEAELRACHEAAWCAAQLLTGTLRVGHDGIRTTRSVGSTVRAKCNCFCSTPFVPEA